MATFTLILTVLGALSAFCASVAPLLPTGRVKSVMAAVGIDLAAVLGAVRK